MGRPNMMMEATAWLIPLFFLTALVYASVGFAGGSTYLALLVLFAFPYETMPKVALLCNLVVSAGGLYLFLRAGHFSFRLALPFILLSVPMAYVGGSLPIGKTLFLILLGASLGVAGLRLLISEKTFAGKNNIPAKVVWGLGLPVGGVLGFVSGLIGIGGGIFLAPLLYFLQWGNGRQIAAQASFFIFVNSLSGLLGQWVKVQTTLGSVWIFPLLAAVFLGGQVGSRLGAGFIPLVGLQKITAVLILLVAGRIFWGLV